MNVYTIGSLTEEEIGKLGELYNYHEKQWGRQRVHMALLSHKGYSLRDRRHQSPHGQ